MATQVAVEDRIDEIVDRYEGWEGTLVQVLLDAQRELNWLPSEALRRISERLDVALPQVYRVASFYSGMSLVPRGKHLVNVCLGTACHVRGSPRVLDKVVDALGAQPGATTGDGKFTLRTVNCLGCCALGPVMVVDEEYYGKLPPGKVTEILASYN